MEQSRAENDAGMSRDRSDQIKRAGQGRTEQDRTGQDRTGQDRPTLYRITLSFSQSLSLPHPE